MNDLRKQFQDESNRGCFRKTANEIESASFCDEYVEWLEKKVNSDVVPKIGRIVNKTLIDIASEYITIDGIATRLTEINELIIYSNE